MLEKLTQNTFARMTVAAVAMAVAHPVYGDDYPVYNGSPNKETFGKQWVTQPAATRQTPAAEPFAQQRISYSVSGEVEEGMLQIKATKTYFEDTQQQFLLVQTQEQTMYRPKCKALVKPATGATLVGCGASLLGMLIGVGGLIAEEEDVAIVGGIMTGGGLAIGLGSTFGIIGPCSKFKATDKTRITELSKTTETHLLSSNPYSTQLATNLPFSVSSSYFTFEQGQTTYYTNPFNGTATVQLQPTDFGFAFSQQGLAEIPFAQQLLNAGYSQDRFLPLLQQKATSVTHYVTIETKATDGTNAKLDVPVHGFTVPAKAMEQIIMGL